MKIEESNGAYLITQDPYENFWHYWAINVKDVGRNRPKLKEPLKEWWDTTAPGEWTTTYIGKSGIRAIVIRDPKLFALFKLAFSNTDLIKSQTVQTVDAAAYYAPYVPLTVGRQTGSPVLLTDNEQDPPTP